MAELCRQRNEMVNASYALGQMSLDSFAQVQADKVRHNRQVGSLRDASDFEASAVALTRKLLGDEDAEKLQDALKEKAICTADHHGSLYCSQFLQSDLLFALIMEKLGKRNPYVRFWRQDRLSLKTQPIRVDSARMPPEKTSSFCRCFRQNTAFSLPPMRHLYHLK